MYLNGSNCGRVALQCRTAPRHVAPRLPLRRQTEVPHWRPNAGTAGDGTSSCTRPLDSSRELAWCREQESRQAQPILIDPYAAALAATAPQDPGIITTSKQQALHVVATKYIDQLLDAAMAATSVNRIAQGDFRQVVLLVDGMDTRPYRLLWPTGTIIFLLAPSECHELAEAVLRQAGAAVPRGCMLRRVNVDLQRPSVSFAQELEAAGFRPDRLSVWALQGVPAWGTDPGMPLLKELLMEVTNMAGFNSLVLGELPEMGRAEAENLMAEFGLLGTTVPLDGPQTGHWDRLSQDTDQGAVSLDKQEGQRWLFSSQQMRLSLAQMGVYEEHSREAEEIDEDFIDNFS